MTKMFVKKIFYRIFQKMMNIALYIIKIKEPIVYQGENAISVIPNLLVNKKVFIVTDATIMKLGYLEQLIKSLDNSKISYIIYDKTLADPSIFQIEEALALYNKNNCTAIIAFGGGSPMDLAKATGARVACPNKTIPKLKGVLKVRKKLPLLIAIPTTVGTGSEATVAAVVSNKDTKEKYAINDPVLIPKYAILDPKYVYNLPRNLIASTGMDALTHAIEAFLNKSNTKKTKEYSKEAVKIIFNQMFNAYNQNHDALKLMQLASYKAGVAFTRAYVGNVHAIAHTLGGFYNVAHGYANAVILPHVLTYYGKKVYKKLAVLYDFANHENALKSNEEKAKALIEWIYEINGKMDIPLVLNNIIIEDDLKIMISRAYKEANPLYPVPVIFSRNDFKNIYKIIDPKLLNN